MKIQTSDEFHKWWDVIVENNTQWTTLERLAALAAWNEQQAKIDKLEEELYWSL